MQPQSNFTFVFHINQLLRPMTPSRLLAFCFIVASTNCYAQSVYTRVINGFTAMAGGKTEWIDLDKDNDLDLLFSGSDGSSTLTIVYENVAGTFSQRSTNLPIMSAFSSADYDNDGDMDLLAFNWTTPFVKLYRNDGGFVFSESASFGAFSPSSAVWLDIDNDEDLDFVLVGNIAVPRLFENTGTGFTEMVNTNFPDCSNCNSDVADVNGDGKVDIIFTGDITSLYLNAGNKKFNLYTNTEFKQPIQGDVACGDFDGDGDFDILLTGLLNSAAYTAIYENKNNQFVERTDLGLTPVVTNSSSGLLWFNANNDGKVDIFLSGSTDWTNVFATQARVFKNNGDTFIDIQDAYLGTDRFTGSYDAGDFDNDGDMDLGFQGTHAVLEGVFLPRPVLKRYAGFYRHDEIIKTPALNTKPLPPAIQTFSEKAYRKEIRLKWGDGSDGETPTAGLFYNFYLRDANKKLIVPNVNFSNGNILATNAPNGAARSGYAFDMPEGSLYYAVQSVDGAKTGSVFSTERMFHHFNGPEALTAEFTDQQHVNLSWLDHSILETNFEVLRSTSPTTGLVSIAILPANTKSHTDNFTFATETEYHYRIRGYNAQASVYDSLILVIPNRPTDVAAESINASQIRLTWKDQSQYETAYIVERKEGNGTFTTIATLGPNVTQFEDTQLSDGLTYEYRVISKGKNGALAPVTSATAITNATPNGLAFEVSADEDRTLVLTSHDFNSHFTDSNASDKLVKFKIVSLPDNGTLYVYTSKAVVGQEVTPDLFDFVEFKPFADYVGTTTFSVLPYDGKDYSDNDWIISLNINQINDPPVFDLVSPPVYNEDFIAGVRITPQSHYFPDEESQVITYSLLPQTSDIVEVVFNPTTGEILLGSREDKFGEVEFTVTANDGQMQNNTYSQKVKFGVRAVNDPPVFGPIENVQAESYSVTINLDVQDPDDNVTAFMFSTFSSNSAIVKQEKIKFSTESGKIIMTVFPEAKLGDTNITVMVNDGSASVTQQFKFSVVLITALDDDIEAEIILYPNPVSKDLQIQTGSANKSLTFIIRDVHGRRLQSGIIDNSGSTIDLSEFRSGLYFVEFVSLHKIIATKKIIKL
jgi:hypothetical protein